MERDIKDILTGLEHGMLTKEEATKQLLNLHIVSNPLPTKEECNSEEEYWEWYRSEQMKANPD